MKTIGISLLVVILLSACSSGPAADAPTDPGRSIAAGPGQQFKIVIESNPSTGYHWEIVGSLDQAVVRLVGREYKGTATPEMPGSGGVDIWTFEAAAAGQTTITLGYYPPDSSASDPVKTETFQVVVK